MIGSGFAKKKIKIYFTHPPKNRIFRGERREHIRVFGEWRFWDSARALFRFRCGIFFFRCGIFGFTTQRCGIKKTTPEHRFPWFSAISPQHEKEKKTGCAQVVGKKVPKHNIKNSARPADLLVRNPKMEIPKHSIANYLPSPVEVTGTLLTGW